MEIAFDYLHESEEALAPPAEPSVDSERRVLMGEKEFNAAMTVVRAFDDVPPEAHGWLIGYVNGRRIERERAAALEPEA